MKDKTIYHCDYDLKNRDEVKKTLEDNGYNVITEQSIYTLPIDLLNKDIDVIVLRYQYSKLNLCDYFKPILKCGKPIVIYSDTSEEAIVQELKECGIDKPDNIHIIKKDLNGTLTRKIQSLT